MLEFLEYHRHIGHYPNMITSLSHDNLNVNCTSFYLNKIYFFSILF